MTFHLLFIHVVCYMFVRTFLSEMTVVSILSMGEFTVSHAESVSFHNHKDQTGVSLL